jgi:prepilin-type N-terminal cleavage/methylation domain-containing protein
MRTSKQSGFTLIETAIVIAIAAIVIGSAAALMRPYISSSELTTTKLKQEKVSQALAVFAQRYGRMPCPADPNDQANGAIQPFGYPHNSGADGSQFATTIGCGGVTSYNGILPFKVLGLSEEQAKDSYGNFFTYAVSPGMTEYSPTIPANPTTQPPCFTTAWTAGVDSTKTPIIKNKNKAHLCCPIADAAIGELKVTDALGSNNSLFNAGPQNQTKVINGIATTKVITIVPDNRNITGDWYENESNGQTSASAGQVMSGRWHKDDEDGHTHHEYASLKAIDSDGNTVDPSLVTIEIRSIQWEPPIKESASGTYNGRPNTIMVGRTHTNDENGNTQYMTGYLYVNGVQLKPTSQQSSGDITESAGTFYETPSSKLLTSRTHTGDENKKTQYYASQFTTTITIPPSRTATTTPVDRLVAFVLVSHGKNGDGAWMKNTGRRQPTASSTAQESINRNGGMNFVNTTYSTTDNNNYFDDAVTFKTNDQLVSEYGNNNCSGPQ